MCTQNCINDYQTSGYCSTCASHDGGDKMFPTLYQRQSRASRATNNDSAPNSASTGAAGEPTAPTGESPPAVAQDESPTTV